MLQLQEAYCMLSGNYIISSGYLYRINLTHMEKQKMQSRISRNRPDQDFIHLLPSGYFAYSMWLQLSTNLVSQAFWTKSSPEPQWTGIALEMKFITYLTTKPSYVWLHNQAIIRVLRTICYMPLILRPLDFRNQNKDVNLKFRKKCHTDKQEIFN